MIMIVIKKLLKKNNIMTIYNDNYYHHYLNNIEISGVFNKSKYSDGNITNTKYILFIKFEHNKETNVYIDISNVGNIVVPFHVLMKNRYFSKYYNISLMFIEEKNLVIERSYYNEKYNAEDILDIGIEWFIDPIYIVKDEETKIIEAKKGDNYHRCNINPYSLRNLKIATDVEIAKFCEVYDNKYGYEEAYFEEKIINYINIMINQTICLMKKDIRTLYSINTVGTDDADTYL